MDAPDWRVLAEANKAIADFNFERAKKAERRVRELEARIAELEAVPEYVDTQGQIEIGILRARIAELEGALIEVIEEYNLESLQLPPAARAALHRDEPSESSTEIVKGKPWNPETDN